MALLTAQRNFSPVVRDKENVPAYDVCNSLWDDPFFAFFASLFASVADVETVFTILSAASEFRVVPRVPVSEGRTKWRRRYLSC